MKQKLIAMLITTTLLGGVGATAYASANTDDSLSNCKTSIECNKDNITNNRGQAQNCNINCEKVVPSSLQKDGYVNRGCISYFRGISKNLRQLIYGQIDFNSSNSYGENESLVQNNKQNNDSKKVEDRKKTLNNKKVSKVDKRTKTVSNKKEKSNRSQTLKNNSDTKTAINSSDKFMEQVQIMIFKKVNEERKKAGIPELSYNNTMEKYAKIKSQDMGDRKYFDHKDPEGNLITVKMKGDGVNYRAWGENIAYIGGVSDANELANQFMTNWMNSPGHRANILSNNFSSIGVGVYKTGNTVYATQEFYR